MSRGAPLSNGEIAERLRRAADLLQQQGDNPFRAAAYRHAADTIVHLPRALGEILEREGEEGLIALPAIGRGIATAVREMLRTGRWAMLERLQGQLDPVELFQLVPGIGPELAERIQDTLGIDDLEALEVAAHDGRLEQVEGIGPRRAAAVRASLASILGRRSARRVEPAHEPQVATLLDVDAEYRRRARAGELRRIAPRRFNPSAEAWLPILHAERDGWRLTALYSNTALAHRLGRTDDWVVLYFYDDHHVEGQCTVVTETRGPLAGRRVVRGREAECRRHYLGD